MAQEQAGIYASDYLEGLVGALVRFTATSVSAFQHGDYQYKGRSLKILEACEQEAQYLCFQLYHVTRWKVELACKEIIVMLKCVITGSNNRLHVVNL